MCEGLEKLDWTDEDREAYEKDQEAFDNLPWAEIGESLKTAVEEQKRKIHKKEKTNDHLCQ